MVVLMVRREVMVLERGLLGRMSEGRRVEGRERERVRHGEEIGVRL